MFVVAISCTLDKTDYEAEISNVVSEYHEFKEAVSFKSNPYTIRIEALNGTFYKGYNKIRLDIFNTQTNTYINNAEVTFLPIMGDASDHKISCPQDQQGFAHKTQKK